MPVAALGRGVTARPALLLAGALGGLAALAVAQPAGLAPLPELSGAAQVSVALAGGAAAAWVGVCALSTGDPGRRRSWVLALLCGLSWQPALLTARHAEAGWEAHRAAAELAAATEAIRAQGRVAGQGGLEKALRAAVPAALAAVDLLEQEAPGSAALRETAGGLIAQMAAAAPRAPRAAAAALERIGIAAAARRERPLAEMVIAVLGQLRAAAPDAHRRRRVATALRSIAEAARQNQQPLLSQAADTEARREGGAAGGT